MIEDALFQLYFSRECSSINPWIGFKSLISILWAVVIFIEVKTKFIEHREHAIAVLQFLTENRSRVVCGQE